jgi:hypothetical protein
MSEEEDEREVSGTIAFNNNKLRKILRTESSLRDFSTQNSVSLPKLDARFF